MNQGTARIVIIVALVIVGGVVLANGFDDDDGVDAATPSATSTPSPSETASPSVTTSPEPTETPSPQTQGVIFMSLNGTDVAGLAGEVQEMLEAEGYIPAKLADNAPQGGVQVTVVYYRGGENTAQNRSDATYVAETFFEGAEVARLNPTFDDVVPNTATIAIVVGQDYADSVAAGE